MNNIWDEPTEDMVETLNKVALNTNLDFESVKSVLWWYQYYYIKYVNECLGLE